MVRFAKITVPRSASRIISYCGAALLTAKSIDEANKQLSTSENEIRCIVESSPISDEAQQLFLPMHADIKYTGFTINPEEKTFPYQVRALAMKLAQSAKFYADHDDWEN
jgi:hypothetical protein